MPPDPSARALSEKRRPRKMKFVETPVENGLHGEAPSTTYANGSHVEITKGDCAATEFGPDHSVGGVRARVDGQPYVAQKGPNAGKIIQPVRDGAGMVYGVPVERLRQESGHGRPAVGWSRAYEANYDRIFRNKKKGKR